MDAEKLPSLHGDGNSVDPERANQREDDKLRDRERYEATVPPQFTCGDHFRRCVYLDLSMQNENV